MKEINHLTVKYHGQTVGTLAETTAGQVAFQYDAAWLREGFSISPLSLPLSEQVFLPKRDMFEGLFGVFADSLPDGWGRLLVDRMLRRQHIPPDSVSAVMRLAVVGSFGMGALEYEPEVFHFAAAEQLDFDLLAAECRQILAEKDSKHLSLLFQLGGSSGGARPKVLVSLNNESWIVKFPSSDDRKTIGKEEYKYMQCARHCQIETPEVRLFPAKNGDGYFGARRFDIDTGSKVHMVSAGGILETSHHIPNLDYHDLMKLTFILTKDSREVEALYRRMCFNVYAHNRDDHSKNFSYLYDERQGRWVLSPAYDLTYSNSIGGEHATSVNGSGRNPRLADLLAVGVKAGLSQERARKIAKEIAEIVETELGDIITSYR